MRSRSIAFWSLALVALAGAPAGAAYVSITTPANSTQSGLPVGATASFTTSDNGTITVVVTDTVSNPTSVVQNISGLAFTLDFGPSTASIDEDVTKSFGTSRTVKGTGAGGYTDNGAVAPTGWSLSISGSQITLTALGGGQPTETIIGSPNASNAYANAGGSIAGNGPHNPFLYGPVTFTLDVAGVTSATMITSATFSFGTTPGANTTADVPTISNNDIAVPEPSSLALVGIGLAGFRVVVLRRRRAAA
jgi:hypothetical protein